MKKRAVFVFILASSLFLLSIISITSAVEFEIKDNFDKGETLLARVSGNFLDPVLPENVFFYREHIRVAFLYDIAKIQDEYYIYALLPEAQSQTNYSIVIKDIQYMKGSKVTDEEIRKNFTISDETADFNINPGYIVTNQDFFIKVQNLQDNKIDINIDNENNARTISLKSGDIKKINFNINDFGNETVFKKIKLSSSSTTYEILAYLIINKTQDKEPDENEVKERNFRFSPIELNVSMATNSQKTKIVYLYNTGQTQLENITLTISSQLKPYTSFSIDEIDKLEEGSNIKIELYISSPEQEKYLEGQIKAHAEQTDTEIITAYIPVTFNFLKDYTPPLDNDGDVDRDRYDDYQPVFQTCEEMDGKICSENEKCDGPTDETTDGICCLGVCKEKQKSPVGKIIGFSIVIILIVLVYWFFIKRYKGTKRKTNLIEIAEGRKK